MFLRFILATAAISLICGCEKPIAKPNLSPTTSPKTVAKRMLTNEIKDEIATLVREANNDKARMLEIVCEELYKPGELEPSEVSAAIDAELAKWSAEKKA